jgi:hypothetical protein
MAYLELDGCFSRGKGLRCEAPHPYPLQMPHFEEPFFE